MIGLGLQQRLTALAFVVELTCVGGHGLLPREPTARTRQYRFESNCEHLESLTSSQNGKANRAKPGSQA